MFSTNYEDILQGIQRIEPERYSKTRNFENGAVTRLSPYISRGVISTKQVFKHVQQLSLPFYKTEKLIQELAWRDYWQQIWIAKGDEIFSDLRNEQQPVINHEIPTAILEAKTGIEAVDRSIDELYETGYMHNHMRMYVAAICCNIAQCHWLTPARWLYAHLYDGDLASNHLSWQWVSGANANKKYYANQENINKYFNGKQTNTFLDVGYEAFEGMDIPDVLKETAEFILNTNLPQRSLKDIEKGKKTLVYNYYNLDPNWHEGEDVQRVFLLETELFNQQPVSDKSLQFALGLAQNIPGLKIFSGAFNELENHVGNGFIVYKEHPTNRNYRGTEESRDWMFDVQGYHRSFFSFWKKCKKQL